MKIPFIKMHGAGNDFILVDDRQETFPISDASFLEKIGTRRTGVGCDGIILIQPSQTADVRMRFFNPDGQEQDMCGNGARCFARLAFDIGAAPEKMQIQTRAGKIEATVKGDQVTLLLTDPKDWKLDLDVGLDRSLDFVNTGVEHAVLRVDDLGAVDVDSLGRNVRFHDLFSPLGTNANFVQVESDGTLSLRTYERGVEAETLACGTGAAATAVIAQKRGWVDLPVAVHCAGGYDLVIDSGSNGTTLSGGAEYVFSGELEYGNWI